MKSLLLCSALVLGAAQIYPGDIAATPAMPPGGNPMGSPNNVNSGVNYNNNNGYNNNGYNNGYNNGPLGGGGSPLGNMPVFNFPGLFDKGGKNDYNNNNQPRSALSLLMGSYAFGAEGTVLSRGQATLGSLVSAGDTVPVSVAGLMCFDGWGGCTVNLEANIGGLTEIGLSDVRLLTPPGNCSYTMNPNGTGTVNATFFADTGSPIPEEVLQLAFSTQFSVIVVDSTDFFFTLHGPLVLAGEAHRQIDDFVTPYSTMSASNQRRQCPILVFRVFPEGRLCGLNRPACPYGQYCSSANSCGFTTGICRRRPSWCDNNVNQTCCSCAGSMLKQFKSECWANYHGWEKAWDGNCH